MTYWTQRTKKLFISAILLTSTTTTFTATDTTVTCITVATMASFIISVNYANTVVLLLLPPAPHLILVLIVIIKTTTTTTTTTTTQITAVIISHGNCKGVVAVFHSRSSLVKLLMHKTLTGINYARLVLKNSELYCLSRAHN